MAEVTVSQLAKTVGASVDRLLSQMKEAGLDHKTADQPVSDEDKQKLLAHLKSSHGASTATPKRITLKRKTLGTVKATGSQGRKTVSVEVRKKRTYVKRDEAAVEELPEAVAEVEELPVIDPVEENVDAVTEVVDDSAVAEESAVEVEAAAEDVAEKVVATEEAALARRVDPFDAEELRQRAATKRKEQESADKERRSAAIRAKAEEAARLKAEEISKKEAVKTAKDKPAAPKHFKAAPTPQDEDEPRRKANKGKKTPKQRGKNRGHHVRVDEFMPENSPSFVSMGSKKVLQAHSRQGFQQPTERIVHEVAITESITVSELAQQMAIKANVVIKELMKLGVMSTINQAIDQETAVLLVEELGHSYRLVSADEVESSLIAALTDQLVDEEGGQESRPPVVTVMGLSLYTSYAGDDLIGVGLGGRPFLEKQKTEANYRGQTLRQSMTTQH